MYAPVSNTFSELTSQLRQFDSLWRDMPFYSLQLSWREQYSRLDQALLALTNSEFEQLNNSPSLLSQFLSQYLTGYADILPLLQVSTATTELQLNRFLATDVSGRKWQQIEHFIQSLPERPMVGVSTLVDWCAGKSHLGRSLAHHWKCNLRAVERDLQLCAVGTELAKPFVNNSQFDCCDVLLAPVSFAENEQVIALHACGDLHRTLLKQWLNSNSPQLVLAPCCYHQWLKQDYQPLSKQAQQQDLQLTKNQVRLAVQEMVTSSVRIRRQVNEMKVLRLAFDLVQRDLRGVDEYLTVPSLSNSILRLNYRQIMQKFADSKGLTLPDELNLQPYLVQAKTRFALIQRLQLASHGFRRALEMWIVLDLMLYLEEGGCEVSLTQFCERNLTPRNLQIYARR